MGDQRVSGVREEQAEHQFMKRLLRDVRALEYMLAEDLVEKGVHRIGAEQELFLVDRAWNPVPINLAVLEAVADPHVTTEVGRFNVEFNLDPLRFEAGCLAALENEVQAYLERVRSAAHAHDAEVVLVGVLPTIRLADLTLGNMTPHERYHALNERLTRIRGSAYSFHIQGLDELTIRHNSVMLEACNTSFQVHYQADPDDFAHYYNVAQVVTAPVLAASVNAPLLFGRRLWKETRIALFQQAVDTRDAHLYLREMSPRVSFGNGWVRASVLEIFKEDIARYRVIIGAEIEEDPFDLIAQGQAPRLRALQVHNSTVYRWNRACYGVTDGKPHLRIENRALPSGPTPADEVANAAFWLGLLNGLAEAYDDVSRHLDFDDAKTNFYNAARRGLDAQFHWFGGQTVPARELILQELLPLARLGLDRAAIAPADRDRYLDIVEARVTTRRTGAWWMLHALERLEDMPSRLGRLNTLVGALSERQQTGEPVHTWDLPAPRSTSQAAVSCVRVYQCMSTDLFTVNENELVDLAAAVMDWQHIRHLPVEDEGGRLVGMLSLRNVLGALVDQPERDTGRPVPVREIMAHDVITVTPETPLEEAARLMRTHKIGALPVVQDDRLVGIITERDFVQFTAQLLARAAAPD